MGGVHGTTSTGRTRLQPGSEAHFGQTVTLTGIPAGSFGVLLAGGEAYLRLLDRAGRGGATRWRR